MLGKGIAIGKNKNFYNLIGKKYLNKKTFPYGNNINLFGDTIKLFGNGGLSRLNSSRFGQ